MQKEIYIIRHGETEENRLKKPQGRQINSILNETGKQQALITGKYLKKYVHKPQIIFTSPLYRAHETASIIGKELNIKKIIINDNLVENDTGKAHASHEDKFKNNKYYDEYKYIEDQYMKIIDPIKKIEFLHSKKVQRNFKNIQSDTFETIKQRCEEVINLIKNCDKNRIIIVSHSAFIYDLLGYIFNTESECIHRDYYKETKNCFISKIIYTDKFQMITSPNTHHFLTFTYVNNVLYETIEVLDKDLYKVTDGKKHFLFSTNTGTNKVPKEIIGQNKYGIIYTNGLK